MALQSIEQNTRLEMFVKEFLNDETLSAVTQPILDKLALIETDTIPHIRAAVADARKHGAFDMVRLYMLNYVLDHTNLNTLLDSAKLTPKEKTIVINALAGHEVLPIPNENTE